MTVLWPAAVLLLSGCRDDAPDRQLAAWRQIEASEQMGARAEVPELLDSARSCYNIARQLTERENGRWFLLRDYDVADSHFVRAHDLAVRATTETLASRQAKFMELQKRLKHAAARVDSIKTESRQHLLRIDLRRRVVAAELHLATAARIASESTWTETMVELDSAEEALASVTQSIALHAAASESEIQRWRHWVDETVAWSRRTDSSALVVIKQRHRAYLIIHGRISEEFDIELGYGSAGNKQFAGDAATPEGIYHITRHRNTGSRYYKALDLDYPNRDDRKRFAAAKKAGSIPLGVRIGGNIEIHGHGGRGGDWTNGCIAVTNEDMDRLMNHLDVGNRVTIVRTLERWPS